jgi:hypothetical protein
MTLSSPTREKFMKVGKRGNFTGNTAEVFISLIAEEALE